MSSMEKLKRSWRRIPAEIRKPIILVVGMTFVLAAGLTGWLPGPGGIPLFLIGVAILATEFKWAERLKNVILDIVYACGRWMRRYPYRAALIIIVAIASLIVLGYILRDALS